MLTKKGWFGKGSLLVKSHYRSNSVFHQKSMSSTKREKTSWPGLHRGSVGNSSHQLNSDDRRVPSPSSPAGTPPKMIWEHKYRSFLGGQPKSPRIAAVTTQDPLDCKTRIPPRRSNSGNENHSHVPESKRSEMKRPISTPSLFRREDSSERGGSLLSGIFRRDRSATSSPTSRKLAQTDELDGTLRRGVEKSYSPGSKQHSILEPTLVKQWMDGAPLRTGSALPALLPPLTQASISSVENHKLASGFIVPKIRSAHNLSPSSVQTEQFAAWNVRNSSAGSSQHEHYEDYSTVELQPPPMPLSERDVPLPGISHKRSTSGLSVISVTEEENDFQQNGNNLELDISSRKKITEIHNEKASDSPFVWEDTSCNLNTAALWTSSIPKISVATSVGALPALLDRHTSLEPVAENIEITNERMLSSFVGVEQWKPDRRYLIGPAAFVACPMDTSCPFFFGNSHDGGSQSYLSSQEAATSGNHFRSVLLGQCLLSYALTNSMTARTWSRASLILVKNYLLEYDVDCTASYGTGADSLDIPEARPRGYVHMEGAVARPHADFADAVELDFFGSPCLKTDVRRIIIRVAERSERNAWVHCFNRAANLQLSDLYDIDSSLPLLGEGNCSHVYQARPKDRGEKVQVALKLFNKASFWRLVSSGKERADTLVRETSVQATLTTKQPDVKSFLRVKGFFETSQLVVLELELLDGLDLFRYISVRGVVTEHEAANICADIVRCLVAMNRIGASHRDIKPANILMCDQKEGSGTKTWVKVCDFGMATFVGMDGQVRGRCGTPGYVAPEIFTTEVYAGYGKKTDVYSLGVTLYVMLCGYEPFYGRTEKELVEANKNSIVEFPKKEWSKVSKEARNLVELLMEKNPENRPSAEEVLRHPWFRTNL